MNFFVLEKRVVIIVEKAQSLGLKNAYHFEDNQALMTYLDEMLEPEDTILIKGSNGMHLKEVVEHFKGESISEKNY